MSKKEYNGLHFDSKEELEFYWWLEEAYDELIVLDIVYHPEPYTLFEKALTPEGKTLLREHKYTPDFVIEVPKELDDLGLSGLHKGTYIIDVKGGFNLHNNLREFSINRKWMFQKYGIYVNKVEPTEWFHKHWCPKKALLTPKTKQIRKKYQHCKLLADIKGEV